MKHTRKALVICDHLPHKDPRVIWHIMSLRENYEVDVFYLNRTNETMLSEQLISGVRFVCADVVARTTPAIPQGQTIPQRMYAIKMSITSPFWHSLYNALYIPARWTYRRYCRIKAWMKRLLYDKVRKKRGVRNFLVRYLLWSIVLMNDLLMLNRTCRNLKSQFSCISTHYDLIVASDLPVLQFAVNVRKTDQGVLVYDAHENWSRVRPGTPHFYAMAIMFYERWLARKTDIVTTVSPLLVEHLRRSLKHRVVLLLPNAAPLRRDGSSENGNAKHCLEKRFVQEMSTLARGRLVTIFLGGVAAERGLREIVTAWEQIPDCDAILVIRAPDGTNEELDTVVSIATANGTLNKTVFVLPSVTEEELIPAASSADVGIIPYRPTFDNHIMACPNKLSQYMQAGVAILTNDIPYPKQIVTDANCGLIYSDLSGCDEIVDRIMYCCRNRDKLNEFKRNAQLYCRSHYNWDMFYSALLVEIDSVCGMQGKKS